MTTKKNIAVPYIRIVFIFALCLAGFSMTRTAFAATVVESKSALVQSLEQKTGNSVQYSVDTRMGKVTSIRSTGKSLPVVGEDLFFAFRVADPAFQADQFVKEYGTYFGAVDPAKELIRVKQASDSLGMTHVRYGQTYNGIPVFGGQIIVHLNNDTTVRSANGSIVPDISTDTSPNITREEAIGKAKALWQEQKKPDDPKILKTTLYILNKRFLQNNAEDATNHLVWEVDILKEHAGAHERYYIDAHDGTLVHQISGILDALSRQIYDCSYGDGDCYLDTLDPISGYTYGRSEGQPARGPQPMSGDTDTDDLYDIVGSTHDYYATNFSRDGANNLGGIGDGTYSPYANTDGYSLIDNTFWGLLLCPNAYFDGYSLNFCQGYVTVDIAAHEYAHAVNTYSVLDGNGDPSGLIYEGESGALNESNSDVFGEAVEYAYAGSNDWLIGAGVADGPFRDMQTPSNYTYNLDDGNGDVQYPNRYNSDGFYCGDEDGGGVHINSSVPNHAAYLIAMGGTYNGCTITGIGREKEEAIFYRAQNTYYTTTTDFNEAYTDLVTSCADLYGGVNSADCINVIKALRSVEMDQPGKCSGTPRATASCTSPTITGITSSKANGTYKRGSVIDIQFTFSHAMTSSGIMTVTLETGATDRKCTFRMTNATTGTCRYTVQSGDRSSDLNVRSITGTISDTDGWRLTSYTPARNLANNKNLVIDGTNHTSTVGFFRPSTKTFYLKRSNKSTATYTKVTFGQSTDIPFSGDWNGDNIETVGFFRPSTKTFYLKRSNKTTSTYTKFTSGKSTDKPIIGDWNGDGVDTIGFFRPRTKTFYLKNTNTAAGSYTKFAFGQSTDIPISGDWNGDGKDTIGIFRPSTKTFYLKSSNKATGTYTKFTFGQSTDIPISGDWNHDGKDTIGIFRPSTKTYYLKSSNRSTGTYTKFTSGKSKDLPFAGAWK